MMKQRSSSKLTPRRAVVAAMLLALLAGAALSAEIAADRAVAQVTVDAASVVRSVDGRFFGLNATIWDEAFSTPETTALLAAAGIRVLRFPGGSLSDEYHWKTNTTLANTWTWVTSFDDFAKIAVALNACVFITANYGTGTAQEAAEWVTYANLTRGYGFRYWEIGNESYGSWETDAQAVRHDPFT